MQIEDIMREYGNIIGAVSGARRRKRFISVIRKMSPTLDELSAMVGLLNKDRWLDPFGAIAEVRHQVSSGYTVGGLLIKDKRIADALQAAAKAAGQDVEGLILDVLTSYLIERSYLSQSVAEQQDVLKFVEASLVAQD